MTYQSAGIMDLLKASTAEQHRDAEHRRLQQELVSGRVSAAKYSAWLGQMFLLHKTLWEEIFRRGKDYPAIADVVRDEGRHVANLRADLARLGNDATRVVPLPSTARAIQEIRTASESDPLALLGYNYVLEGSMNGNRFIAKALARTLEGPALAYLDPYGEEQRATWQAYRERMGAAHLDAEQADRVVAAARGMFGFIATMSDELMEDPPVSP
jgi:heme oxygenase